MWVEKWFSFLLEVHWFSMQCWYCRRSEIDRLTWELVVTTHNVQKRAKAIIWVILDSFCSNYTVKSTVLHQNDPYQIPLHFGSYCRLPSYFCVGLKHSSLESWPDWKIYLNKIYSAVGGVSRLVSCTRTALNVIFQFDLFQRPKLSKRDFVISTTTIYRNQTEIIPPFMYLRRNLAFL